MKHRVYVRRSGDIHGHGGRRLELPLTFLLACLSRHSVSSSLRYLSTSLLGWLCRCI